MKLAVIDNYDSFTYNLVHYIEPYVSIVDVFRNDEITIAELQKYDAIVISPGPGLPAEAGISLEVVKNFYKTKKILGICLGHQAIALTFGAKLRNLNQVQHGVSRPTILDKNPDNIFNNLPSEFLCGRYHSWVISEENFPKELRVTARDNENNIMAIRHKKYDVHGFQFHPESILTEYGHDMIKNWLNLPNK